MEKTLPKLTREDVRLLHGKLQLGRVKAAQALVREGAPPLGLFIVRSGSVLVQRNVFGNPVTVATLGVNEMFGESAFINPQPQPAAASVVAAEDTEVMLLTPARLAPLFQEHPELFGRFFQSIALVMSRRLRHFNQVGGLIHARFADLPAWEIL